VRAGFDAPRRN